MHWNSTFPNLKWKIYYLPYVYFSQKLRQWPFTDCKMICVAIKQIWLKKNQMCGSQWFSIECPKTKTKVTTLANHRTQTIQQTNQCLNQIKVAVMKCRKMFEQVLGFLHIGLERECVLWSSHYIVMQNQLNQMWIALTLNWKLLCNESLMQINWLKINSAVILLKWNNLIR